MLSQPIDHGREMERRLSDPACERGAVQIKPGAAHDLRLPVKRQVIGVFRDQHMGDGALGRQRSFDQMRRRRRLGDAVLADAAGVFRADCDDDPELSRHDVEALRSVLADPRHVAAAAGTERALGLDYPFDPRQLLRQAAEIAVRRGSFPTGFPT